MLTHVDSALPDLQVKASGGPARAGRLPQPSFPGFCLVMVSPTGTVPVSRP